MHTKENILEVISNTFVSVKKHGGKGILSLGSAGAQYSKSIPSGKMKAKLCDILKYVWLSCHQTAYYSRNKSLTATAFQEHAFFNPSNGVLFIFI